MVFESAHYYYYELNIFSIAFNNHLVSVFLVTANQFTEAHTIHTIRMNQIVNIAKN